MGLLHLRGDKWFYLSNLGTEAAIVRNNCIYLWNNYSLANPFSVMRVTVLLTKYLYLFTEVILWLGDRWIFLCGVLGKDVTADGWHLGGGWYDIWSPAREAWEIVSFLSLKLCIAMSLQGNGIWHVAKLETSMAPAICFEKESEGFL